MMHQQTKRGARHLLAPSRAKAAESERLTITLGEGQRAQLEAIAEYNRVTLAFVVRYALSEFVREHADKQIPLQFPPSQNSR